MMATEIGRARELLQHEPPRHEASPLPIWSGAAQWSEPSSRTDGHRLPLESFAYLFSHNPVEL